MTPAQITDMIRQTLFLALEIAAPFLILALAIGLIISLLQSLLQIQEMTLAFVPKMLIVALALAIFFPWILKMMTKFTHHVLINQWDKVVSLVNYVQ